MAFKKGHIPWNKNKSGCYSEETRKKISIATSGENNPNYKGLITIYCKICEKEMKVHPFESNRKYCSHKCQGQDCLGEKNLAKLPEIRKKISEKVKGKIVSEETRKKMSIAGKLRFSDPKNHHMYNKHHTKETREKISKSHIGIPVHSWTEELRSHMREINLGTKNPNWKGGLSFEPYCPKFNKDLKRRVRLFFEDECVLCGKTSKKNKRKLSVHHVEYNKQSCCDGKPVHFAALCSACHARTNSDRDRWEAMLHRVIDELYNGRSYFTKEEYMELTTCD